MNDFVRTFRRLHSVPSYQQQHPSSLIVTSPESSDSFPSRASLATELTEGVPSSSVHLVQAIEWKVSVNGIVCSFRPVHSSGKGMVSAPASDGKSSEPQEMLSLQMSKLSISSKPSIHGHTAVNFHFAIFR